MENALFRKSALQTLSSPEQLDQLLKITRPRAWIALCAIGAILVAAILWGIFGSLPTTVIGQGLVMHRGGIFNIVSVGSGTVTEIGDFKVGELIREGQLLGRIAQPQLEQQVKAARDELARLHAEERDTLAMIRAQTANQDSAFKQQQAAQEKIIEGKEQFLRSLRTVEQSHIELLKDGLITKQRQEEGRQAIFAAQSDIDNANVVLQKLNVERQETAKLHEERLRTVRSHVAQAQNRVNDLQLQFELASNIVSVHEGHLVELMVVRGDTVKSGRPILSLEMKVQVLEAIIYLPPRSNAKLLKPGMAAQISPVTAKKERYGYLIGKVAAVSRYPSTEQGMMSVFNNQALVQEMSKSGPPIAVEVEFVPDRSTKSGYQWSSQAGASVDLTSGTLCAGTFIIEKMPPIHLIIPILKEAIGL